jgi:hypothetical protein
VFHLTDSILDGTKRALGIADDYLVYDQDILMHINSVFSTLQQLGIGPVDGFAIEDNSVEWDTFLEGNLKFNQVKTYMYLRVRLLFDPPTASYLLDSTKAQIGEFEWRIRAIREETEWVSPTPPPVVCDW